MTTPVPANGGVNTVPVAKDASNRAWRTLLQALGLDVAIAVVLALAAYFAGNDIEWTGDYWVFLASLVGKSVVLAIVSFFVRYLKAPVGARQ